MPKTSNAVCKTKEYYRGLWIDKNMGDHNTEFYSVFNPKNRQHVHDNKKSVIKRVIDCYWDLHNGKYYKLPEYGRAIRNKAERLSQECPVLRK